MLQIKVVDRFHQTDTAYLKQIVHIFTAVGKALYDGQDKLQIAVDQYFLRLLITLL